MVSYHHFSLHYKLIPQKLHGKFITKVCFLNYILSQGLALDSIAFTPVISKKKEKENLKLICSGTKQQSPSYHLPHDVSMYNHVLF